MNKPASAKSASAMIDQKIRKLGDWRGETLGRVREVIRSADPLVTEEMKWINTPAWSHDGIICTGETYKETVKLTFAKGASLPDPSGIFNASLDGKIRRAIDLHAGDTIDAAALGKLIQAAVALNQKLKAEREARKVAKKQAG